MSIFNWIKKKPKKSAIELYAEASKAIEEWIRQQDIRAIYDVTAGYVPEDTREAILKSNFTEDTLALQAYMQMDDLTIEFMLPTQPGMKKYCRLLRGDVVLREIDMGSIIENVLQGEKK